MSNKTISINPSLFSVVGSKSKTKKNREKKPKTNIVPLISPNVIKNKLLKRIKEHKQKETQNLANNKKKIEPKENIANTNIQSNKELTAFNDEFNDSLNYLQSLSKQKHIENERRKVEESKQKRREELDRMTVRNYHSMNQQNSQPLINIDLPEELVQPTIPINSEPFKINVKNDVPYGILKGGTKPSYREWSKTQRNNIVTNPNASLVIDNLNISKEKSDRENRLNLLKQKIKSKNEELQKDHLISENLIKKPVIEVNNIEFSSQIEPNINDEPKNIHPTILEPEINLQSKIDLQQTKELSGGKLIATKHITKKTIKRKYTLGRSKIKRTVGVLIKDRGTRKKVLHAKKDLKRKNINDIKTYLREHNLIKIGSNAPNDVLRKLYESAMLSGEITNSNPSILLHNFSKEDKQL
jgi:hypothetical protein